MAPVQLLLDNIQKFIRLDAAEQDYFLSLLSYREVKKREHIVRAGQICRHEHFVLRGCFRSYSIDDKGAEHIVMFAPEDYWMGDLYSFLTGKPARFSTDALEDSLIAMISREDLQSLYDRVPKFDRFFRILFQNALVAQFQRIDENLSLSAEDKYRQFREKYPGLESRIPQKEIAAYIGVTPEFLSKMRKRMLNG